MACKFTCDAEGCTNTIDGTPQILFRPLPQPHPFLVGARQAPQAVLHIAYEPGKSDAPWFAATKQNPDGSVFRHDACSQECLKKLQEQLQAEEAAKSPIIVPPSVVPAVNVPDHLPTKPSGNAVPK